MPANYVELPRDPLQEVDEFGIPLNSPLRGMLPQGGIPPAPTQQEVSQQFQSYSKPPPWTPGRIASSIIGAPFNLLHGLDQGLKGALGIPTIEDAAARGRAIYGQPRSESRAFGGGAAEEPDFGDRFLGALDGSSRRDMNAAFMTAMDVRRQKAERKLALGTIKDVQTIEGNATSLRQGNFNLSQDLQYGDQERRQGLENQRLSAENTRLNMDATNLSMQLNELRRQQLEAQEAETARIKAMFSGNPALLAGTVGPEIATALGGQAPSAEMLAKLSGLRGAGITQQQGVLNYQQDLANPIDPGTGVLLDEQTRRQWQVEDAASTRAAADAARVEQELQREIDNLGPLYERRAKSLSDDWNLFGFGGDTKDEKLEALVKEQAQVSAWLRDKTVTPSQAALIAGGVIPLDTFRGSTIDSEPEPTPVPQPTARSIGEPVEPTSEDARRDDAVRAKPFIAMFRDKWQREKVPLGQPLDGTEYRAILQREAAKNGVKIEELEAP